MILIVGTIIIGFVSVVISGIQQNIIQKEKAKRIEAERKLAHIIQQREAEMLYDMQTRDEKNVPHDREWIHGGKGMPAYRNIPRKRGPYTPAEVDVFFKEGKE